MPDAFHCCDNRVTLLRRNAANRSGLRCRGVPEANRLCRCARAFEHGAFSGCGGLPAAQVTVPLHAFGGRPFVDGVEHAPGDSGRADEQRAVHAYRLNVRITGGRVGRSEAGIC